MRKPLLAAVLAAIGAAQLPDLKVERQAPEQPLPFSHKQHATVNAMKCEQCHPIPDPGDFATLPKTALCMGCHSSIKTDSPHIKKLSELHAENKRVPWVGVYRVPDWVSFNHRKHVGAGAKCQDCHGPVGERTVLRREKDLSMAACMDCHRAKRASNDCLLCHDHR